MEVVLETTENPGTVVGAFRDYADAQKAVGALEQAGFTHEHIGVLRKGEKDGVHTERDHGKGAGAGVGTGLVEGGVLGAAAAFLIPGAGPVIGAGILGTIILGALTGGATGGIVGALTGAGVRHDDAEHYGREFEAGNVLVTVRAPGRELEAHEIIGRYGMSSMKNGGLPVASGARGTEDRIAERDGAERNFEERPTEPQSAERESVAGGEERTRL
ncbi:MAG: general stress protein [Candidatus Dormibacteria bacterium]